MSEPKDVVLGVLIDARLTPEEFPLIDALISCLTEVISEVLAGVHFDVPIDVQTRPVRAQHNPNLYPAPRDER